MNMTQTTSNQTHVMPQHSRATKCLHTRCSPLSEPGLRVAVSEPGLRVAVSEPGLRVAVSEPGLRVAVSEPGLRVALGPLQVL